MKASVYTLLVVATFLPDCTVRAVEEVDISSMRYRATVFAVPYPDIAAEFFMKYFGARVILPEEFITNGHSKIENATTGTRFMYNGGKDYFDLYFVKRLEPKVLKFQKFLRQIHRFDVQETWDQYQDWHMAIAADSLDNIVYRFTRDHVPFITRSFYSLYFEIPYSGFTVQILAKNSTLTWTEPFNFCRVTSGDYHWKQLSQPLNLSDILENHQPKKPDYSPSHHSYFSAQPSRALEFVLNYTTTRNFLPDFSRTHKYGDGKCATLKWAHSQYGDDAYFQIHFVWNFRKYAAFDSEYPCVKMESVIEEENRQSLRQGVAASPWLDYRLVYEVKDLRSYLPQLNGVDYLIEKTSKRKSLLMSVGALTVELVQPVSNLRKVTKVIPKK